MSDRNEAVRVGIWVLVVSAIAGLLVLLFYGSALAQDGDRAGELAELLSRRAPLSAEERMQAAEDVLAADRRDRTRRLATAVFDTGWRVWQGASPRRAVSAAARLARAAVRFRSDRDAELAALDLLQPGLASEAADPRLERMYEKLRERDALDTLDARLDRAERALERGDLRLARVRLERSLELAPDSERAAALHAQLLQLLAAREAGHEPAGADVAQAVEAWEPALAIALLVGDYERAAAFGSGEPDAEFARAVAQFLGGSQGEALRALGGLAVRDDATGDAARSLLASPGVNVELALARAQKGYRARRTLGWMGGDELAEQGLDLSRSGVGAWRGALEPGNLALAAPLRLWSGWEPDGRELEDAASRYLEVFPEGEQSGDAQAWLEELRSRAPSASDAGWDDGRFVLPRARTRFSALAPRPLLVSRRVLDSDAVGDVEGVREALADGDALLLVPAFGPEPEDAIALDAGGLRTLLAELARGVEQDALEPLDRGKAATLEALRRLDAALAAGRAVHARAWKVGEVTPIAAARGLMAGSSQEVATLQLSRDEDDVRVARGFGRSTWRCPEEAFCIDREELLSGALYGRFELDADFRVGARTSFSRASLALEVGRDGPQASVVLPIGHWLRLNSWIPIEARFSIGLDGIDFGPGFRDD